MSRTDANRDAVLAFADAFNRSDWEALAALCAEDFRWVVPTVKAMQSPQLQAQHDILGVTLTTKDRSFDEMLAVFKVTKQTSVDGRFELTITGMTAEEDRVAAEAEGYAVSIATGRTYTNRYLYLMHFRDGKIRLFREYQDTLHAYDVWMAP